MLGIIVIFFASWLLLYFFQNSHIDAIGIIPTSRRMLLLLGGVFISLILCSVSQTVEAYLGDFYWQNNSNLTVSEFAGAIWFDFKSVVTEELIFRGALLYILINK